MDPNLSISIRSLNTGAMMPATGQRNRNTEDGVIDLKDVQNFLFVVVSSHMRVEGDRGCQGQGFNAYA